MDPLQGEARSPSGCLKEAHEIEWVNDPDDDIPLKPNRNSTPPQRRSTQTTLSALGGVLTQGPNLAKNGAVGDPTNSVSIRPTRTRKLPVKFKDGLTASAGLPGQISKPKRRIVLTDDEDEVGPRKKRNGARVQTSTDKSTKEGPNQSKTQVFSQGPEGTQDTHANTEDSNSLGGLDDASIRGLEMTEGAGDSDDEEDEDEWDYAKLEKMAAKDAKTLKKRKFHSSTGVSMQIADLIGVFKDGEQPESKKFGCKCKLCKTWFMGNVSTCCTHIIRQWDTHELKYLAGCKKEKVKPNKFVMKSVTKEAQGTRLQDQKLLEGWTVSKVSQWSKEGLKEHLIELVVVDDQAFSLVDHAAFHHLLIFQRPSMRDSDIPHRTTIANAVHEKTYKVRDMLKELFVSVPGEVSVTLDGWSSLARDPYLGVTIHWVHSTLESPTKWSLRTMLLAFWEVKGNHSGDNLAKLVMEIINEAGLSSKIGWITSDNVTSNDKMMARLKDDLDSPMQEWKAPVCRVRCLAHIIHLAAKHIVQAFSQDGPLMESESPVDALPLDIDEDAETSYASGDTLGKLWAFINQVQLSPQASAFFFKCCAEEKLPRLELIKYVRTCWSSMYDLLERTFMLRLGIVKFIQLADDSAQVPKLQKKFYADYKLTSIEWTNLDLLCQILRHPALAQQQFSSECVPTISRVFPTIEFLLSSLEAAKNHKTFIPIRDTISAGITNLTKWYRKLDNCHVYAVSSALDPSVKLAYMRKNWGPEYVEHVKMILATLFDRYNQATEDIGAVAASSSQPANNNAVGYGSNWIQQSLGDNSDNGDILDPRKELNEYLESKREEQKEGLVEWWGHNSTRYPTLSRITRDYLTIQGSSVASKHAFSSGWLTGTYLCNRLKPSMFEALQIVKSAFHNRILNAMDKAVCHFGMEWEDGLVDMEESSNPI